MVDHLSMFANTLHVRLSLPVRSSVHSHPSCFPSLCHRSSSSQKPLGSTRKFPKGTRACISASAASAGITEVSTPHSGYHYNGAKRRFFEGWYFKVSLTKTSAVSASTTLCTVYSEQVLLVAANYKVVVTSKQDCIKRKLATLPSIICLCATLA